MKGKLLLLHSLILAVMVFSAAICPAGQVITEETKQWAKQALSQEKTLSAVTAENSIGVLYFPNKTGNPDLDPIEKGLSIMLTTDLAKLKRFQVVERIKLQALMDEMALGASGLMEPGTTPRVGRLLGARFLSGGTIWPGKATELMVEPSVTDVPDEFIVQQTLTEGDLSDLISIEKEILFNTVNILKIELTPEEKAELEKPLSGSVAALLLFFQGVKESDGGNYSGAKEFYQTALEKDPDFNLAQDGLKELKELNLYTEVEKVAEAETPEPAKEATVEKGSSGMGWVGAGIAVAGVAGGAAYVASNPSSSSDDSGDEPPPPPPDVDETPPTVASTSPANGAEDVDCNLLVVEIDFDEEMDPGNGEVSTTSENWSIPSNARRSWDNDFQTLVITRNLGSTGGVVTFQGTFPPQTANVVTTPTEPIRETVEFVLSGFTDEAGNPLGTYRLAFTQVYGPSGECD